MSANQSWVVALTGSYDPAQVQLLASHLAPGTLALDIGASLGLYCTQLAARAQATSAKVLAIEPVAANAAAVTKNLRLNGLFESASVLEIAVGSQEGYLTIRTEPGGTGNGAVIDGVAASELAMHSSQGNLQDEVTVPVVTLDSLQLDRQVSVIKIDVEGAEMDVLAGAPRLIRTHRPYILGEFNLPWMRARGWPPAAPFIWAQQHQYVVYKVIPVRRGTIRSCTGIRLEAIVRDAERGNSELFLAPSSPIQHTRVSPLVYTSAT